MADVEVTYKGEIIAELSDTGDKTLLTAGKYLEDDVLVEYVKSGGGVTHNQFTQTLASGTQLLTFEYNLSSKPKLMVLRSTKQTFEDLSMGEVYYVLVSDYSATIGDCCGVLVYKNYSSGNSSRDGIYYTTTEPTEQAQSRGYVFFNSEKAKFTRVAANGHWLAGVTYTLDVYEWSD